MKLVYFAGEAGVTNFGDELNHYLWPQLLPGSFDDSDDRHFVGIGTLLNDRLPVAHRTIVFGAGVGYYGPPRKDASWVIYCVRGPLSAKALGLPDDAAVTDPAVLIARVGNGSPVQGPRWARAFMPHWQSEPDVWKTVCDAAGIGFIDPRWSPVRVIDALKRTDVVIAEAMHGAIVADALRIPWIPVRSRPKINEFKWDDWCQSMALPYRPEQLPPVWPQAGAPSIPRRVRRWAKLRVAARTLARIAGRSRPVLSADTVLRTRIDVLEERLALLRKKELSGPS